MIEMCKNFGLRICTGRKPGDGHGRLTFYNYLGSSAIEYAVDDYELYKYVTDFKVLDFNDLSDHVLIYHSLNKCMKEHGENIQDSNGVCIWYEQ